MTLLQKVPGRKIRNFQRCYINHVKIMEKGDIQIMIDGGEWG